MIHGTIIIKGDEVIIRPIDNEVWLTQYELAGLFECFTAKIASNIRAILKTGVLDKTAACRIYYYRNGNSVEQYNLEMIIALSFRIRSYNADTFRGFIMRNVASRTSENQNIICRNWENFQLN
mgnify:FL=1